MARYPRRMILRAGLASIFAAIRAGANSARAAFASQLPGERVEREAISPEQVRRAIRDGVGFLKSRQQADGSWPNIPNQHQHVAGINGLIAHALLTAGESPASPHLAAALKFLEQFSPEEIDGTYSVALQTMAFAESDPDRYRTRIASNVAWLEGAQIKEGDKGPGWPGTWAHTSDKRRPGDNSSTQFALLGLHAASQAGVAVSPRIWERTRACLERAQCVDGGWPYYPGSPYSPTTASMTCAGISGLIITGSRLFQAKETLVGDAVMDCGKKGVHPGIRRGLEWLATNFAVDRNHGASVHHQWKYYYLYGLERASRLTGQRLFGDRDWYREGTQELLAGQDPVLGSWAGAIHEREPTLATSLAVLFLATARAPVLINKLAHGPGGDWNNDIDDIRNLVDAVSADWKHRLTWQAIDPEAAGIEGLLQAPIAYFNGHEAPEFGPRARKILREYVDQGGFILAEACCGDRHEGFDRGFRALMKELFPEPGYGLRQLPPDHGVWRSGRDLDPGEHPLWGIELGCRTAVIYSPADLSCLWNQMEAHPSHPGVIRAGLIGRNIVDYVTGRQLPADRLAPRAPRDFKAELPRRGVLHIAKLKHGGDWNVAPLAIPNLAAALRNPPLNYDAAVKHYELLPEDPNLVNFPLIYIHGKSPIAFTGDQLANLRRHVYPGRGTFFADAACNSPAFDTSFRAMIGDLFPNNPLVPIPDEDELYTTKIGFDLSDCRRSEGIGGGRGRPQLEGVRADDRWVVIYSRYDIGCALEGHAGLNFKGYSYESSLKIAVNIVLYSSMP